MSFNPHDLFDVVSVWAVKGLGALAIFFIGRWLALLVIRLLKAGMTKGKVDETLVQFVGNVLYALALVFITIAALGQLGVQTTSIVAVIAAAGLAIGMALQGSLANLAAGVMLIILRPFKLGDSVKAAGAEGKVVDINIVTTSLKTDDGKLLIIPNAKITGDIITNNTP